jgi:hypothetical protein
MYSRLDVWTVDKNLQTLVMLAMLCAKVCTGQENEEEAGRGVIQGL